MKDGGNVVPEFFQAITYTSAVTASYVRLFAVTAKSWAQRERDEVERRHPRHYPRRLRGWSVLKVNLMRHRLAKWIEPYGEWYDNE